ncbi:hypothetical protein D5S17_12660 [Pseudonocardiaceae bacterium YIM PH 21723]|nr:hypothetical protein D5S17_12660 [Pseudonocardiaceae bacterium YIM PH 21723]
MTNLLIYGANGYTGELVAREAVRRGLRPILAGRSGAKVVPLAAELGLEHRVFTLDRIAIVAEHLGGVDIVLHCAGPFSATSAPMIEGCLRAGAHYLDVSGEIDVFEHAYANHQRAAEHGVVLCPGVGFDVIPTDCVAVAVARALPDAVSLAVGFDTDTSLSKGTAKTALEAAPHGGRIRRDGDLVSVPHAWRTRTIDFGAGPRTAMTVPMPDVSSAYRSTGIPTVENYIAAPSLVIQGAKLGRYGAGLLRVPLVRKFAAAAVERFVAGPDEQERATRTVRIWAEATGADGTVKTARLTTGSVYEVTVHGALAIVEHLADTTPEPGAHTPATLCGPDLVTGLPGSSGITIT